MISRLYKTDGFSYLDIHFARLILKLAGNDSAELALSAAVVSRHQRQGHVCADLSVMAGKPVVPGSDLICPPADAWRNLLLGSPVVGKPSDYAPLILDEKNRLYLYRYWEYQTRLAGFIRDRVSRDMTPVDRGLLQNGLERLFPPAGEETDGQKAAAFTALTRWLCVISGGPGTGKTVTVARLLNLFLEQPSEAPPRIALTAPTGKAAARLQEAIARENEKIPSSLAGVMPSEAATIHRLLGTIPGSPYFRRNSKNPLPVDMVVVDEASMVDLALMSKLVQALPDQARLILLGDKDQLASVEAGAVLGDICEAGTARLADPVRSNDEPNICSSIIQLHKSYRFAPHGGIWNVSRAVNEGNGGQALNLIKTGNYPDMAWKQLPAPQDMARELRQTVIQGFGDYLARPEDPLTVFQAFEKFRILCALRQGPYGVAEVNRLTENILRSRGLISPDKTWYAGRPVLITQNDYTLKLFNGDVGITLPDPENSGQLRVFFQNSQGVFKKHHPSRLPEHETVYAMTVHKSQGSEFERVLLMLPDRDAPVLTRELIYTGITRAIQSVEIWGIEPVFQAGVSRRIQRTSGLQDALEG
jgi:exodeoxyribonuclease V alpha subunit